MKLLTVRSTANKLANMMLFIVYTIQQLLLLL